MSKNTFFVMLMFLMVSCDYWNEKVPDVDSDISSDSKVEKNKQNQLQTLRKSFAKNELTQMQKDINLSLNTYREFKKLSDELSKKEGKDSEAFINLDQEFSTKHGNKGNEIQTILSKYSEDFNYKKDRLVELQTTIKEKQYRFNINAENFRLCREDIKLKKDELEEKKLSFEKELSTSKSQITTLLNKIKAKEEGIARNKKRANNSDWPSDKKKYREKAKKLAKEANELAKKAKLISIKINDKKEIIQTEMNLKISVTKEKLEECKKLVELTNLIKEEIVIDNKSFIELKANLLRIKENISNYKIENKDFYEAYNQYQDDRNILTLGVQKKLDDMASKYELQQGILISNYGKNYIDIFEKLKNWHEQNQIKGQETLDLISELKILVPTTVRVSAILEKMVDILKEASLQVTMESKFSNSRSVASIIGEILDIDIDIDLSDILDIKIDLPNLDLDLSNLDFSIPVLMIPDIDINLQEIDLKDINISQSVQDISDIDITIPNINFVNISIDAGADLETISNSFKNIELKTPEIELVRIESNVEQDLRNPSQILRNTADQLVDAKEDLDRELTNAYRDLKRESDGAIKDSGKILGDAVKELRDSIAMMQGIDIEKTLKRIRRQVTSCRENKEKLNVISNELKLFNDDIHQFKFSGNRTNLEVSEYAQERIDKSETFKVGVGQFLGVSCTTLSLGLASTTGAMSSLATYAGAYGAAAAIAINAMMEQVTEEIEHETKKLAECGKEYQVIYKKFEKNYSDYTKLTLENDKASMLIEINEKHQTLSELILNTQLLRSEEEALAVSTQSLDLLQNILLFQEKFNEKENIRLKQMILEIGEMEVL